VNDKIKVKRVEEPDNVEKIKDFFGASPDYEAQVEREIEQDKLAKEHDTLDEEFLAEFTKVRKLSKWWAKEEERYRKMARKLVGQERGIIQRGEYALIAKERAGRTEVDYETFVVDELGQDAWNELMHILGEVKAGRGTSKYIKQKDKSLVIELHEKGD
jgi:hypothetical protein